LVKAALRALALLAGISAVSCGRPVRKEPREPARAPALRAAGERPPLRPARPEAVPTGRAPGARGEGAAPPLPPGEERRHVLCLYDSTEERTPRACETHYYVETVLNHLGLLPVYRDVNNPLLADEEMSRFRGVFCWFMDGRLKKGRDYWLWLARQARAGRKVVLFGSLGATTGIPRDIINEGLRPLGLTYHAQETENLAVLKVVHKDPRVEFERTLDRELRWYVHVTADPDHEVLLRVRRTDRPGSESDLVTLGPSGGFAWLPVHYDPRVDRDQWRIDPFRFLSRAFGVERAPRPDLTTAMGRRIFFASIDGDGLGNGVQPGPKVGRLCGEVVRDDFIKAIDLPVTASAIAADLDEYPELVPLARSIFELPNVEVAAHGYYHPISWRRKTFPKGREHRPFSLEKEIAGAVRRIGEVTSKPVKIYLWTGACDPPGEAVEQCDRLGIANLNGSDPGRMQNFESLANLRSPTILNEGRVQFNARSMSENHFTDLWTRNFFAYRNVLGTYRRTDSPVRVTPVHVYFHYYLVEQPGGEAALREVYDWVRRQETFPMFASEYVDWVRGFYSARWESVAGPEAGRAWKVRDYGACRTVRFDGTREHVDLARSKNVLGYRHFQDTTLYVHLEAGDEAVIALTPEPVPGATYLVEANGFPRDGRIVARSAAAATFMTPAGPVARASSGHELEIPSLPSAAPSRVPPDRPEGRR
jgi:hypothetical protein